MVLLAPATDPGVEVHVAMKCRVGIASILVLAALQSASLALADSECFKGYRDTTPEERATMTANLGTVRAALPGAPEGWIVTSDDEISPVLRICGDDENDPWSYSFSRSFHRTTGFETRDSLMDVAADVARSEMDAKKPRAEEIEARITTLSQQAVEAAQKGDMDAIEAINQEIEKVSEEYSRLLDEGEATGAISAAEEASRDESFSIAVEINADHMWHDPAAVPMSIPGAAAAYRWGEKGEGQALILVGPWKPVAGSDGDSECAMRPGEKAETAQAVAIQVFGDVTRLESVAKAIDVKTIAALVRKK